MLKSVLAALISLAVITAVPVSPVQAQTDKKEDAAKTKSTTKKSGEKTAKKLTPQQQKMKDCAAKWGEEKKAKNVKGRAAYNKFMSGCLKA